MDNLQQQIDSLRTLQESYDQLVEQNAQLAADVQAIKDTHILGFNYDGIIFESGYEPKSAFGIIANRDRIIEIHDELDDVIPIMASDHYPQLEVFEMRNATSTVPGEFNCLRKHPTLRQVIVPECVNISPFGNNFTGPNLVMLNMLNNSNVGIANNSYWFCSGSPKLIDVVWGKGQNKSFTLSGWDPTVAMLDDSISLLTQEDITAGFESNRQKLLYNIREHIAANLTDRTGLSPYTITFSQSLRNIFDQETEDAFAARGWSIAPAKSV